MTRWTFGPNELGPTTASPRTIAALAGRSSIRISLSAVSRTLSVSSSSGFPDAWIRKRGWSLSTTTRDSPAAARISSSRAAPQRAASLDPIRFRAASTSAFGAGFSIEKYAGRVETSFSVPSAGSATRR
jgi:hypothetical protein